MADAPAAGKKKGKLPVWAWAVGGIVLLFVAYKFYVGQSSSSTTSATTTGAGSTTDTTGTAGSSGSGSTGAGTTDSSGVSDSDLVTALGGQQSSLLQELEAQNQDVLGLAQSQLAAAANNPAISPSSTSETQPMVGQQPGGSNAPINVYVSPKALAPTSSKPPVVTRTGGSKPPATARYFTYKRDVKVGSGQTVHYQPGRGYYAA